MMHRSSNHSDPGEEFDPADVAAADWLVRRDRGFAAGEDVEFSRWLRANPRHAAAFARLNETWTELAGVDPDCLPLPPRRRTWTRWTLPALAAAAALIVSASFLFSAFRRNAPLERSVATEIGGLERLDLPDGSVVRVNTDSVVDVAYTSAERRVALRKGEASFEVAPNKSRPFVVRVGEVDVRAVGTAFNIRANEGIVVVLVTEGRVAVANSDSPGAATAAGNPTPSPIIIGANQRFVIGASASAQAPASAPRVEPVAPAAVERAMAWHDRHIEFADTPLAQIVEEFNRYNRHRLVIADPALGAQRFGGRFPSHDFASLVALLEANLGVAAERRENETILRRTASR